MDIREIRRRSLPGMWQRSMLTEIESLWHSYADRHHGVVDEFGRLLHGSDAFSKFASFIALRLSFKHWQVGMARETKWGVGDHVRKKKTIPREYREFLKALSKTRPVGIVSTNYDIVIEKLLGPLSSGRLGGFNYGIPGEDLLGRHSVSSKWSYGPVKITGTVPLLKLHGSLNWAISPDAELVKYIDCRPSRGQRYEVLILPPAASEMHDQLSKIWHHAHDALSAADVWVICGYSIPEYDRDVQDLLRSASGRVSRVCICDVNVPPVRNRLLELFAETGRSIQIDDVPGVTREFGSEERRKLQQALLAA